MTTSRRNHDLLEHIANAFMQAAREFCDNVRLRFLWPRFLPHAETEEPSTFWKNLIPKINRRLAQEKLFHTQRTSPRKSLSQVVPLPPYFEDRNKRPLFDVDDYNIFLDNNYPQDCVMTLQRLGMPTLTWDQIFGMAEQDLSEAKSNIKQVPIDDDWQTRFAKLMLRDMSEAAVKRRQELKLIPLQNMEWGSANSGQLFLPFTQGVPIPPGIIERTIDPTALHNNSRKNLFKVLGAKEPTISWVRSSIVQESVMRSTMGTFESRDWIHYLYRTHPEEPDWFELRGLKICADKNMMTPSISDVYLPSDHPLGPRVLFQSGPACPAGPKSHYLNDIHFRDAPEKPRPDCPTFEEWLCEFVGIRERLRLVARGKDSLSAEWKYVEKHKPSRLLSLLRHLWPHEGTFILPNSKLNKQIRRIDAAKICPQIMPNEFILASTFLPCAQLIELKARYMVQGEVFPFLSLEDAASGDQLNSNWSFLATAFGVHNEADWFFFYSILRCIKIGNEDAASVGTPSRLPEIYVALGAHVSSRLIDKEHVRDEIMSVSVADTVSCMYG